MSGAELFPIVAKGASETGKPLREAVGTSLADVWQGLWGDRLAAWRLRNAAKLNDALGKELAERGLALNLDKIPERFAYSWFDKASQEDEPEIQALFAKLLANAAEGNDDALMRRNIEAVSRLTPNDAKLLDVIAKGFIAHLSRPHHEPDYQFDEDGLRWELTNKHDFNFEAAIDTILAIPVLTLVVGASLDENMLADFFHLMQQGVAVRPIGQIGGVKMRRLYRLTATGESLIYALYPEAKRSASE
jgi:hypothetical protein